MGASVGEGIASEEELWQRFSATRDPAIREELVRRYLSNTPAVCRASYIDPRVFDRFDSNATILAPVEEAIEDRGPDQFPERELIEAAVLELVG